MFSEGDVIRSKSAKHAVWLVLAVCFDGTLLVEKASKHCKLNGQEHTRTITRPESYYRVGTC